jgi:hypothetical protein
MPQYPGHILRGCRLLSATAQPRQVLSSQWEAQHMTGKTAHRWTGNHHSMSSHSPQAYAHCFPQPRRCGYGRQVHSDRRCRQQIGCQCAEDLGQPQLQAATEYQRCGSVTSGKHNAWWSGKVTAHARPRPGQPRALRQWTRWCSLHTQHIITNHNSYGAPPRQSCDVHARRHCARERHTAPTAVGSQLHTPGPLTRSTCRGHLGQGPAAPTRMMCRMSSMKYPWASWGSPQLRWRKPTSSSAQGHKQ